MIPGVGSLAATLLVVVALSLLACSSESDFGDPENPVAQIAWPDFERLHYDIFDQTDAKRGTLVLQTIRQENVYELSLHFRLDTESGEVVTDTVIVWVDAETLTPVRYERIADSAAESLRANAVYKSNSEGEIAAEISVERIDNEEEDEEKRRELSEEALDVGQFAFDNDSSAWLWRSLAFMQDLELTYRSVNVIQQRSQLVQVAVRGQDTLRGPEGDVVVWQVVATPGVEVSRAWYEIEPPHRLIRWDQQPRRFILTRIETEP